MRAPSPRGPFSFEVSRISGRVVVAAHGTLDNAACPVLDKALRDLIDNQGNMTVVVDLADVTVGDLACIGVLAAAADSAARRGGELVVTAPPAVMQWAIEAADAPGDIAVTGPIALPSEVTRTP